MFKNNKFLLFFWVELEKSNAQQNPKTNHCKKKSEMLLKNWHYCITWLEGMLNLREINPVYISAL